MRALQKIICHEFQSEDAFEDQTRIGREKAADPGSGGLFDAVTVATEESDGLKDRRGNKQSGAVHVHLL